MKHYFKARNKGREDFDKEFGTFDMSDWIETCFANSKDIKSFLDYKAEEIRLAVIEDVRECALIKVRKTDFGNENSEDIKHNEIIMDFLAKLPSER